MQCVRGLVLEYYYTYSTTLVCTLYSVVWSALCVVCRLLSSCGHAVRNGSVDGSKPRIYVVAGYYYGQVLIHS